MFNLKLTTIFVIYLVSLSCCMAGMAEKLLPSARFGGWSTIRDEATDTNINQIWRTTLTTSMHGIQGFVVTSYRVEDCLTENAASTKISDFISRRRFSDYIAKGYEVIPTPWNTADGFGAIFNINGINRGEKDIYNRAVVYAFGLIRNKSAITLEVRLSVSSEESNDLKKCIDKNDVSALSTELVAFLIPLWQPQIIKSPEESAHTPMAIPDVIPETPETTKTIEVIPEVIIELKNNDQHENTNPIPSSVDTSQDQRWFTVDHHLSIVIPPTWKYTGNDKISTWVNKNNSSLRIYSAEKYDTNADLAAALDDFAVSHQAISFRKFVRSPFEIDDAVGVLVRYSDYMKNTSQSYLFGKSNRIWRIDISIPGESAPLSDEIKNMILSVKAD